MYRETLYSRPESECGIEGKWINDYQSYCEGYLTSVVNWIIGVKIDPSGVTVKRRIAPRREGESITTN